MHTPLNLDLPANENFKNLATTVSSLKTFPQTNRPSIYSLVCCQTTTARPQPMQISNNRHEPGTRDDANAPPHSTRGHGRLLMVKS
jgi:hypothetical protein